MSKNRQVSKTNKKAGLGSFLFIILLIGFILALFYFTDITKGTINNIVIWLRAILGR